METFGVNLLQHILISKGAGKVKATSTWTRSSAMPTAVISLFTIIHPVLVQVRMVLIWVLLELAVRV